MGIIQWDYVGYNKLINNTFYLSVLPAVIYKHEEQSIVLELYIFITIVVERFIKTIIR